MPEPQPLSTEGILARAARRHSLPADALGYSPDLPRPVVLGGMPPSELSGIAKVEAMVPRRYADAVPEPRVWGWVDMEAMYGEGSALLLMGPTGTGKTYQAWAAVRALGAADPKRFTGTLAGNVATLLDRCRPDRDLQVGDLEHAPLLLLDDMGAGKVTDWTEEVLYRVIDARWANVLPTIVTTNHSGPSLSAYLGDRLASRLRATSVQLVLDGPDRRREK